MSAQPDNVVALPGVQPRELDRVLDMLREMRVEQREDMRALRADVGGMRGELAELERRTSVVERVEGAIDKLEGRVAALERFRWTVAGGAAVLVAVVGTVVKLVG